MMQTTSGITIRLKGEFILISQTDALNFEKVLIAIPKDEFLTIVKFVDEHE